MDAVLSCMKLPAGPCSGKSTCTEISRLDSGHFILSDATLVQRSQHFDPLLWPLDPSVPLVRLLSTINL